MPSRNFGSPLHTFGAPAPQAAGAALPGFFFSGGTGAKPPAPEPTAGPPAPPQQSQNPYGLGSFDWQGFLQSLQGMFPPMQQQAAPTPSPAPSQPYPTSPPGIAPGNQALGQYLQQRQRAGTALPSVNRPY